MTLPENQSASLMGMSILTIVYFVVLFNHLSANLALKGLYGSTHGVIELNYRFGELRLSDVRYGSLVNVQVMVGVTVVDGVSVV